MAGLEMPPRITSVDCSSANCSRASSSRIAACTGSAPATAAQIPPTGHGMSQAPRSSRGIAPLHLAGALLAVATVEDPAAVARADGEPGTAEAAHEARHPKAGRLQRGDLRSRRERAAVEHGGRGDDGHDRLALARSTVSPARKTRPSGWSDSDPSTGHSSDSPGAGFQLGPI